MTGRQRKYCIIEVGWPKRDGILGKNILVWNLAKKRLTNM